MKIFISYRRDDSADATGRLYDRLEQHYGAGDVFIDVDTIPLGMDFRKHLSDAVSQCDVLLAIIGERWIGTSASGSRRIDDPRDFVRIEVESALTRDIPVVPVLVGAGNMPSDSELPESLKDLAFRNAAELRSGRYFRQQLDHLIHGLERLAQLKAANAAPAPRAPPARAESRQSMVKCPFCDFANEAGILFCEQCKSDLESRPAPPPFPAPPAPAVPIEASAKCSVCGGPRLEGALACMDCGYMFDSDAAGSAEKGPPNVCLNPACGVANPPDAHYCQRCGMHLSTAIGTLIQHRYRIEKQLAVGGFGCIYLATDTKAGDANVVVKEMLCTDPSEFSLRLSFFQREAEILSLLAEVPAVPRCHGLIEEDRNAYLIIEYVKGTDLLRVLESNDNRPFPLDDVVRWGIDICDILKVMHGLNPPWVHRDMKPDNTLLKEDGTIKLIDFGTSRSLGFRDKNDRGGKKEKSDKKTRVYTEGYAPPEQIVGHPEPRSDIFALAAMLYHLATGKAPEGFYTQRELQAQLDDGTIPRAERWFYELLKINLAEDVNDRYYSVRWLKHDLAKRTVSTVVFCPKCKKSNKLRTPYCEDCKTPLTPKLPPCNNCGTVNRMGSRNCTQCDNRLR